ncbi:zinc ribbon domain-containing protein [Pseudomonas monteilii]|uniref:zinc ribbon domain-containing protein n=1 Tax=Pseudomonas monteilii TaxID=76759 RepID=UPI00383AD8D4
MDVLVGLVALAVFVGTWWWLAKEFRKSGRGFLVRHVLGCVGGWMLGLLVAGIAASTGVVEPKTPHSPAGTQPGQSASSTQPAAAAIAAKSEVERGDYRYSFIKDEYRPGMPRRAEVLLSRRLTDSELATLAAKLNADFKGKPSWTFFGFRVDGQNAQTYWANARFDPKYSANVIGLSLADYEQLEALDPAGYHEIKGRWLQDGIFGHIKTLYRKDGKYFIDSEFSGGEIIVDEFHAKPMVDGALRLEDVGGDSGEYFVLDGDGALQAWSENGNYRTLPPKLITNISEHSHNN